ncbi:MAG: hypothetical protein R6X22_06160 [Gemmatimonadota bacterium]
MTPNARRPVVLATLCVVGLSLVAGSPPRVAAQTMPGPAWHGLLDAGAERVAQRLSERLDPRADPDPDDVRDLLDAWRAATGGPSSDWDWLAVGRLWLRAGDARSAGAALARIGDDVPEGLRLLELSRVAFLAGGEDAAGLWWRACAVADEAAALEAWLDLEPLATPEEAAGWDALRRLPAGQRDDCALFRRFLNRRALASASTADARLAEHYDRLRFVRDRYRRRGKEVGTLARREGLPVRPAFDDRGLLHLRIGPPDRTASFLQGECYEPNVTWAYDVPGGARLYHLSPLGGTDDWWLLDNLARVFRCPVDPASGLVIQTRDPMVAPPPPLGLIPAWLLQDLYLSRAGLDPDYARMASRFERTRTLEELQRERNATMADASALIADVPERPAVDLELGMRSEWLQFRSPRPGETEVWVNAEVPVSDLRDPGASRLEVDLVLLDESGERLTAVSGPLVVIPDTSVGSPAAVAIRLPAGLAPGSYRTTLVVREAGGDARPRGTWERDSLVVRDFGGTLPQLSDVAVSPDSGGAWEPRPDTRLRPSPTHRTGPGPAAWIYVEAYNLTPGGAFEALAVLEAEQGGPARDAPSSAFRQTWTGTAARGGRVVTPILLRLELGATPPGRYRLSVTVTDAATGVRTLAARTPLEVADGG